MASQTEDGFREVRGLDFISFEWHYFNRVHICSVSVVSYGPGIGY